MPLPTFIIGGVRRGGTTSLYYGLQQHPDIFLYPHSELNYFVDDEVSGRKWHENSVNPQLWEASHSVDDYASLFAGGEGAKAIGHKGADLLFWYPAHERMARFVPHSRFIFSLRHPVKRAWSHYWAERAKGRESMGFEEALEREEDRAGRSDWARYHLSYRARGFYECHLQHFFRFFPREQVLVVTLEEKIAKPRETLQHVYRFLDVDPELGLEQAETQRQKAWATRPRPWTRPTGIRQLVAVYEHITETLARKLTGSKDSRRALRNFLQKPFRESTRKIAMAHEFSVQLGDLYRPHITALEDLLGRSFDEWR